MCLNKLGTSKLVYSDSLIRLTSQTHNAPLEDYAHFRWDWGSSWGSGSQQTPLGSSRLWDADAAEEPGVFQDLLGLPSCHFARASSDDGSKSTWPQQQWRGTMSRPDRCLPAQASLLKRQSNTTTMKTCTVVLSSQSIWSIILEIDVIITSETSVCFYQTIRRSIPEDIYLRILSISLLQGWETKFHTHTNNRFFSRL